MFCVRKCLFILCFLVISVCSQLNHLSPCPKVFRYVSSGQSWYGIITISPPYDKTINVTIHMDTPAKLPTNFMGRIELLGDKSEVLMNLINGNNLNYKVTFPLLDVVPAITEIIYNDRLICSGPKANAPVVTPVKLYHNLNANIPNGNNNGNNNPYPQNTNINRQPINGQSPSGFSSSPVNHQNNFVSQSNNVNQNNVFQAVTTQRAITTENINRNPVIASNLNNQIYQVGQQSFLQTHKKETQFQNFQYNSTNIVFQDNPVLGNRFAQQSTSHQVSTHKVTEQHTNAFQVGGQQFVSTTQNSQGNKQSAINPQTLNPQAFSPQAFNYAPQPSIPVPTYTAQNAITTKKPIDNKTRPNPDTFALFSSEHTTQNPAIRKKLVAVDIQEVNKVCGYSKIPIRLSSSNKINEGSWPWLAAIYAKKINGIEFLCGGILVSKDIVATAAHCLQQFNNRPIKKEETVVKLGLYNIQDWTNEVAKTFSVNDVIIHPEYDNSLALSNDIALLRINRVNFSDTIIPACLWTNSNNRINDGALVGWGYDSKGHVLHSEPHYVTNKIVSLQECRTAEPTFAYLTSNTTFCGKTTGANSVCNGDSGSGLLVNHNNRWYLRGITSTLHRTNDSKNSCKISNYIIHTDITKYSNWISNYFLV